MCRRCGVGFVGLVFVFLVLLFVWLSGVEGLDCDWCFDVWMGFVVDQFEVFEVKVEQIFYFGIQFYVW